uniref:Uncharacterized protein n=1 Tax=Arundo donax TaxID=35708 RepID=A0A0A9C678_ARUDO
MSSVFGLDFQPVHTSDWVIVLPLSPVACQRMMIHWKTPATEEKASMDGWMNGCPVHGRQEGDEEDDEDSPTSS